MNHFDGFFPANISNSMWEKRVYLDEIINSNDTIQLLDYSNTIDYRIRAIFKNELLE
jgi:hypothetical protein